MPPAKSKTPKTATYTGKGTKQRSFQLSDAAFKIVEDEAARLAIPNSAALSIILDQWAGSLVLVDNERRNTPLKTAAEVNKMAADHSDRVPPASTSSFNVVDPANGKGTGKPSVQRMRNKHDDQTDFGIDED